MEILRGLDHKLNTSTVATIGTFDGVHLGHQKIIQEAAATARSSNRKSVLITFDRHPKQILTPGEKLQALTTIETKIRLISRFGLDFLLLLEFNRELAGLTPEEFCGRFLVDKVNVSHLFVGENFRFGAKAAGSAAFLEECGKNRGFQVNIVPLLKIDNTVVSSTKIRSLVLSGEAEKIPLLLGRYHFVTGKVAEGARRGVKIGFPTANLDLDPFLCLPREGVYAGYFWLKDEPLEAVINVGSNPTFGPGAIHMEAHIFDFSRDIYGENVRIELQKYIRAEAKFASVEALTRQIGKDAQRAGEWLKGSKATGRLDRVESRESRVEKKKW